MEYNEQIQNLLESYHDKIETEIMPLLTKEFNNLHYSVSELCGKLKNKGLLKEDPYFKESEIIELTTPSTEPFQESESNWKTAERITHFESILSYIAHNYSFSLNTFNFNELEKLKHFLDYYSWKDISNPNNSDLNTHSFGKIIIEFKNTQKDSLVLKAFDNTLDKIIKSKENILNNLKVILIYLKESYKLFIREDLIPIVNQKYPGIKPDKIIEKIISEIKNNYSYLKSYKKYIDEVVKEEFYPEGNELKDDVIKKLTLTKNIEKKKDNKNQKEIDPNTNLIQLLLEIGKIRIHLGGSIDKLLLNHTNLKDNEGSFFSKIIRKISKILFNIPTKTIYTIRIKSSKNKEMNLHFENFYEEIKKVEYNLLRFAEEDKIQVFINDNQNVKSEIDKLLMIIKKKIIILIALDEYLKFQLKLMSIKAKGIKPELTIIKTLLNNITQMYSEYLELTENQT